MGGGRMRRLKVGSDGERRVRGDIFPPQVSGVYDQSQVRRLVGLEFAKNTLIAEAER